MANIKTLYGSDKLREAYPKVNENFNNLNADINVLRTRVNTIITTPIDGEAAAQELVDARDGESSLGERLERDLQVVESHLADLVTDSDGVHGLKIEQGIWTPYFFGNTTPGTPTYTVQNGYYYKINRLVFISGSITISAVGGMTGTLLLGGLPFAVSGNQAIGGISIGYKNTVNNYHFGFMPNTSRLQGYNGIDVVDSSEIPSNLSIQFTGVYLTN